MNCIQQKYNFISVLVWWVSEGKTRVFVIFMSLKTDVSWMFIYTLRLFIRGELFSLSGTAHRLTPVVIKCKILFIC